MAEVTRRIGLSLGADVCWPLCFEHLVKRLNLKLNLGGDTVRFEVERVAIQPFSLRDPVGYDVVVDRLTHWMHSQREWIKKGLLMDGLYVFNNPWSVQSNEKHTSYAAMMKLGLPIPETWMLPAKEYSEDQVDAKVTLKRYAKLFDLGKIGEKLGWPFFMKPYDGGGWRNVTRVKNTKDAWTAYDESGKSVMHAQASVEGYEAFVRTIGFGPQTRHVSYAPDAPLHDRYTQKVDFLPKVEQEHLRKVTLTINAFFGWDFNSCESLRKNGVWHPIDFANPCPDSQVTSLHFHFPWLVKSYLRWTLFCAATKRQFRKNLDWAPFYEVAAKDLSYAEKLDRYAAIADQRFETARFEEFCGTHLKHLDAEAYEFFATPEAKEAVRQKVAALFPAHEVEKFTDLFWQRIQSWRAAGCP
ncbi:MAG: hypothetical protein ABTQ32_10305 [Myxococcaceae bacterium]